MSRSPAGHRKRTIWRRNGRIMLEAGDRYDINLVVAGRPSGGKWVWRAYFGNDKIAGGEASSLRQAARSAEAAAASLDPQFVETWRKFARMSNKELDAILRNGRPTG
jgi:hypothetical protein